MGAIAYLVRSWRCAHDGDRYVCGPREDITEFMVWHNWDRHGEGAKPCGQYLQWYVYANEEVA